MEILFNVVVILLGILVLTGFFLYDETKRRKK